MPKEVLSEIIPLRISRSMKKALEKESERKSLPMATYMRQILTRRNGKRA